MITRLDYLLPLSFLVALVLAEKNCWNHWLPLKSPDGLAILFAVRELSVACFGVLLVGHGVQEKVDVAWIRSGRKHLIYLNKNTTANSNDNNINDD